MTNYGYHGEYYDPEYDYEAGMSKHEWPDKSQDVEHLRQVALERSAKIKRLEQRLRDTEHDKFVAESNRDYWREQAGQAERRENVFKKHIESLTEILQSAIEWDSHDDQGVPAVWLERAQQALAQSPQEEGSREGHCPYCFADLDEQASDQEITAYNRWADQQDTTRATTGEQTLRQVADHMAKSSQEGIDSEAERVLYENRWDLYDTDDPTEPTGEPSGDAVSEALWGANESLHWLETVASDGVDDMTREAIVEAVSEIRRALSQPAPVPESVKLEWDNLRNYALGYGGSIPTAEELDRIEAALAAHDSGVPEGYVLVPKEPTQQMIENGNEYLSSGIRAAEPIWKVMCAAAPRSDRPAQCSTCTTVHYTGPWPCPECGRDMSAGNYNIKADIARPLTDQSEQGDG